VSDESISGRLLVRESPGRGRGVFALRDFEPGELIETAPVIVLPPEDRTRLQLTTLARYQFKWPRVEGATAVPLGYAMLHNHSSEPNATREDDPDEDLMHFLAVRPIAKGDEITVNYGRDMYGDNAVDPPPWWSWSTAGLRGRFRQTGSVVLVGAIAALSFLLRRRRRARRSLAGTQ